LVVPRSIPITLPMFFSCYEARLMRRGQMPNPKTRPSF
jgi:hypothetical protein